VHRVVAQSRDGKAADREGFNAAVGAESCVAWRDGDGAANGGINPRQVARKSEPAAVPGAGVDGEGPLRAEAAGRIERKHADRVARAEADDEDVAEGARG